MFTHSHTLWEVYVEDNLYIATTTGYGQNNEPMELKF